jgi:hypothetical protein
LPDLSTTTFAWRFGGPLAGLPPALAWTLLGLAFVLGATLVVLSYRRTLAALAPAPRLVLTSLRVLLLLGLLLALAGPSRVERDYSAPSARPLAVLVDQSGSMTTPDNRQQRRLDEALRRWRALAPAAEAAHPEIKLFAFADTPAPVPLAPAALHSARPEPASSLPASETRLFTSIDHLLASAPPGGWGGIVTLTDGLDTVTSDTAAALSATAGSALAVGTPLHFVTGRNRHAGGELLVFRELALPARVPPRSTFRLELTLDTHQPASRDLPVHLRVGDTWRPPVSLRAEAGRRALAFETELAAEAPGLLPLEIRVGDGPGAPTLRAEVRIAPPDTTRILYHQGALDWGYRFLADILARDPAFRLTPVFNITRGPAPRAAAPRGQPSLQTLPATAAGLDEFDIVILSNTAADQLSPDQQAALTGWVRGGGVLLFLTPDDASAHGYAGSELERMLPVQFMPPGPTAAQDAALAEFRNQMNRHGGANSVYEQQFADQAARNARRVALHAFAWEPRARALLGEDLTEATPRFASFARVRGAKPGAEVLARHPAAHPAGGDADERPILLALQRYGRGQSAVLTTDALWRWKLDQSSRERGVEKFWQNLLSWLARERVRGVRFERPPLHADLGREISLRLADAPSDLTLGARRLPDKPGDPAEPATPLLLSSSDSGARVFPWTPPREGVWEFSARVGEAPPVRHWITVTPPRLGESSGLPADETLLRALAERSGGGLLTDAPPAAWLAARGSAPELLRESIAPLWHGAWFFAVLLALYLAELLLRRRFRLL